MSKHETWRTRKYWRSVGGLLIEEFVAVKATKEQGTRLIDGLIVLGEETKRHEGNTYDISGKDVIVIQTKKSRLGMYLLGQAYFSKLLLQKHNPRSIKTVAVCGKNDKVMQELAEQHNIEIVVIDEIHKGVHIGLAEKPIICMPEKNKEKRFLIGRTGTKTLLAIALNPSTADETTLDPTSRNIETLAVKNNCDGWYMVNLYAGRTSKPEFLPKAPDQSLLDDNIEFIKNMLHSEHYNITKVLLCWGNGVDRHEYLRATANQIIQILKRLDVPCYFMKMTGSDNPYHPAPTPVNRWLGGINKVVLNPYDLDKLK